MWVLKRHLRPGQASVLRTVSTCHCGILLFAIFSPLQDRTHLAAQQSSVKVWGIHRWNVSGVIKIGIIDLSFSRGKKRQMWFEVELELGKWRSNSWDMRNHWWPRATECGFAGSADGESPFLYCRVDFPSPNNHILCVFWSAPVLHGWRWILRGNLSGWQVFYCNRESGEKKKVGSLHRRTPCLFSEVSSSQLVCNRDASTWPQSERRKLRVVEKYVFSEPWEKGVNMHVSQAHRRQIKPGDHFMPESD